MNTHKLPEQILGLLEENMGRKNKAYYKDLHQQAYDRLVGMQAFGESKKASVQDGTNEDKIFSYNTYQTYWKHTKYFVKWVQQTHPDCTTLKKAEKYVPEWLQARADQKLSAWTLHTEAAALNKLYGIKPDDEKRYQLPQRKREDIKRSRVTAERDRHFSVTNNAEFIAFCKGTGLRREGMESIRGRDLMSSQDIAAKIAKIEAINAGDRSAAEKRMLTICKDAQCFKSDYFIYVKEKGGRERLAPIIGEHAQQIVERFKNTAENERVWQHVPHNADIHSYRGDYATAIYKQYARDIDKIPFDKVNRGTGKVYQSEVYTCRKDEAGKKLDRNAMLMCSKALGHNRIEVVANNYIRGL